MWNCNINLNSLCLYTYARLIRYVAVLLSVPVGYVSTYKPAPSISVHVIAQAPSSLSLTSWPYQERCFLINFCHSFNRTSGFAKDRVASGCVLRRDWNQLTVDRDANEEGKEEAKEESSIPQRSGSIRAELSSVRPSSSIVKRRCRPISPILNYADQYYYYHCYVIIRPSQKNCSFFDRLCLVVGRVRVCL